MIDLRSDAFPPSAAMRQAMAGAATGDELFSEDPTSRALEAHVAALLGKPAAVFVPTGTMGNALAVLAQRPAEGRLLLDVQSHLHRREVAAPAVLAGFRACLFDTPDGCPDPDYLAEWCRQEPGSGLLCLETTHTLRRGLAVRLDRLQAAAEVARRHGVGIHLDGARLFHAAVALDVTPARIATTADTVVISLCKALGAPAGAVLAGPAEIIEAARAMRLALGGTMRQTGMLAAAGLLALQPGWETALARDHALARRLAAGLAEVPVLGIEARDVETNVVVFSTEPLGISGREFAARAAGRSLAQGADAPRSEDSGGVRVAVLEPTVVRLTTYRTLTEADIDRAAAVLVRVAREALR